MRGIRWLRLKRLFDHLKDGLRLDAGLSPSPSALLLDPLEALFPEAVPPAHRGLVVDAQLLADATD